MPCSITMLYNPKGLWQQVHVTMTKHAHRVINLANGMSILLEVLIKTWSFFYGRVTLITFEFACKSIYSFGETLE